MIDTDLDRGLSTEELDVLQEVVNISFGKATAELASVIDIYVTLNVPHIRLFKTRELPEIIRESVSDYRSISVLEQRYWGRFQGVALLVFPDTAGKVLVSLLNDGSCWLDDGGNLDSLERETLKEVGNILVGACVGKVSELLSDVVTYSPPRIVVGESHEDTLSGDLLGPDTCSIMMKTVFSFKDRDVSGLLFLLSNEDSLVWLKMALNQFMEQYE